MAVTPTPIAVPIAPFLRLLADRAAMLGRCNVMPLLQSTDLVPWSVAVMLWHEVMITIVVVVVALYSLAAIDHSALLQKF